MNIIIKTMTNLPEHCYECPCRDAESGYCQSDNEHRYSDYRPFWCPLEELREQTRWVSVNEKLPEEGEIVIAFTEYCVYKKARYTSICGWEYIYESGDFWQPLLHVKAWMPKQHESESEVQNAINN